MSVIFIDATHTSESHLPLLTLTPGQNHQIELEKTTILASTALSTPLHQLRRKLTLPLPSSMRLRVYALE